MFLFLCRPLGEIVIRECIDEYSRQESPQEVRRNPAYSMSAAQSVQNPQSLLAALHPKCYLSSSSLRQVASAFRCSSKSLPLLAHGARHVGLDGLTGFQLDMWWLVTCPELQEVKVWTRTYSFRGFRTWGQNRQAESPSK